MFYSIFRANDTEEETQKKQDADTEAHRRARQNQTKEEKLAKQKADTEAHRRAQQNKTAEEKLATQKANTEAQSRVRQNETTVEKRYRQKTDADAHTIARENETEEHHFSAPRYERGVCGGRASAARRVLAWTDSHYIASKVGMDGYGRACEGFPLEQLV